MWTLTRDGEMVLVMSDNFREAQRVQSFYQEGWPQYTWRLVLSPYKDRT